MRVFAKCSAALENPQLMRRVQGWLVVFFIVLIPVSLAMGWVKSVTFVSALSLWALVASHGAWWAASSVEVKQDEDDAPQRIERKVDELSD